MTCAMKESVETLMREDFRYADLLWLSDFEMDPLPPMWVQYVEELKQRGMRLYAGVFRSSVRDVLSQVGRPCLDCRLTNVF